MSPPSDPSDPSPPALSDLEREAIKQLIIEATRQVYDPELPLNVYDLGLIYSVEVDAAAVARLTMTLTNPACPVAGTLPKEVEAAACRVRGVVSAEVTLTWTPPWSKDRLSPEHQLLFSTFM
jgi:metal-sulfur cluster biosynthetic enzyme